MKSVTRSILLAAVVAVPLLGSGLSGCGFHLRGYEAPMQLIAGGTVVMVDDDRETFLLKRPLIDQLQGVGVKVVDGLALIESGQISSTQGVSVATGQYPATIEVTNLRFKKYELVGVLTEIRQVIMADVTYQIRQADGQMRTIRNPIQVERSYQYNAASVSTEDQQGAQIKDWLYEQLAQRITDQYVALSLPKAVANTTPSSSLPIQPNPR